MSAFQHVLVGVDFNEAAATAVLQRACQLTEPERIEAVHACTTFHHIHQDYPVGAFQTSEALDQAVRDEADEFLTRVCNPLGISNYRVLDGRAANALHSRARINADLVVVGSHGRRGFSGMFGSTSNEVLHGTTCDVLAVHLQDDGQPEHDTRIYQRILVAVDLSPESDEVLEHARGVADRCNAQLLLCHAGPRFGNQNPRHHDRLVDMAAVHGIHEHDVHSVRGGAATAIHKLADDLRVDLVVVGTHGKKGLELMWGSTANAVLHGAHCDELAVRLS